MTLTAGEKCHLEFLSRSTFLRKLLKSSIKVCTYVDRHVEVIRLERVCHLPKCAEGIVPGCLFKAKCFLWLTTLL